MKYIIDHELYGERMEFNSIDEAQKTINACYPDELPVSLTETADGIRTARGVIVGYVANRA